MRYTAHFVGYPFERITLLNYITYHLKCQAIVKSYFEKSIRIENILDTDAEKLYFHL